MKCQRSLSRSTQLYLQFCPENSCGTEQKKSLANQALAWVCTPIILLFTKKYIYTPNFPKPHFYQHTTTSFFYVVSGTLLGMFSLTFQKTTE